MENIRVILSDGVKAFAENIDLTEERELFGECISNGANPHMEAISFHYYMREVKDKLSNVSKYNGNHFIFGYLECLFQSDNAPYWISNDGEFEVVWENSHDK